MMKVLLVGRHNPDFGQEQIEIVETKNVQFAARSEDVLHQLSGLIDYGELIKVDTILFQAIPGQLAVAIAKTMAGREIDWVENGFEHPVGLGVVISKPGPRPSQKQTDYMADLDSLDSVIKVVKAVNPNVRVERDEEMPDYLAHFFVDAPMQFVFSHIEMF